jgi:hypothetical protein
VSARRARTLVASAVAATALVAAAPAGAAAPLVQQMVVFKNGTSKIGKVRASAATVKVGGKRCAVGAGTPLAALVTSRPGTIRFTDYGSCGTRARDSGGLYVRAIKANVARAEDGWVYKVGNKAAPAGAADPSGPFGHGLLRGGQRVTWFWCDAQPGVEGCQRTLELKVTGAAEHATRVRVRGYDNAGKGVAVEGAQLVVDRRLAIDRDGLPVTTDTSGNASLDLVAGPHTIVTMKQGLVRAYPVDVNVR